MVAIDPYHPAVALVDEQQVVIVANIGQVATRPRHAPASVPSRAIRGRIIVRPQRRSDAELLVAEGRAIIAIAPVLAPVAAVFAQLAPRIALLAALLAPIAAVAITLCVAQLAAFSASVSAVFADFAGLRLRRGRNHPPGHQH